MRVRDFAPSLLIALAYIYVNYAYTMAMGTPVYPFLTWEKPWPTFWYAIGVFVFGYTMLAVSALVQEWRLGRPLKNCI